MLVAVSSHGGRGGAADRTPCTNSECYPPGPTPRRIRDDISISLTGMLDRLGQVLHRLLHGDLRSVGGSLQVLKGDVGGVPVVVVRHTAPARQAHRGFLPPFSRGCRGPAAILPWWPCCSSFEIGRAHV